MDKNRKSRNIVMRFKSTDDHIQSNFQNRKATAYHKFFKKIKERDNFRFAFSLKSYIGNGIFSNVAIYKDSKIIETNDNFKADVIYQYNKLVSLGFSVTPIILTNTP